MAAGGNISRKILILWLGLFLLASGSQAALSGNSLAATGNSAPAVRPEGKAGSGSGKASLSPDRAYWKSYLTDTRHLLESPVHWKRLDYLEAGLLAGASIGLYSEDREIRDWAQRKRDSKSDNLAKFAKPFGNGAYTLPPLAALYLYGRLSGRDKPRQTALLGLESFVVADIFTAALKDLGHRHRPSSGDPYNRWGGPSLSTSNQSFPSGHSTAAFAVLTVIASEYGDRPYIPPLALGIATLTALSRVNDNDHWASDVLFGSAIGYFTARAILRLHKADNNSRITILPQLDYRHAGLSIALRR